MFHLSSCTSGARQCSHCSKTAVYYVCSGCQSYYEQPLGRMVEQVSQKNGQVNAQYKVHTGPPVSERCPECNCVLHVGFLKVIEESQSDERR